MRLLLFLSFLCFHISTGQAQTSYHELQPTLGKYRVGFSHYTAIDSTRTYKRWKDFNNAVLFRPIPISVWYPVQDENNAASMFIKDYIDIVAEEEEWEGLPEYFLLDWFRDLPRNPKNEQHLKTKTNSFKEGKAILGHFPIVIYSPGQLGSSIENFVMCEYLASQGYVVISSPSRGTETRMFQLEKSRNMETQARDIQFLMQEAFRMKNTNPDKVATIGFSFGGLANVLAQMQNQWIDATISLDGSIKYQYETLKKSTYFDLNKADVPFLHMAQKEIPQEVLKSDKIDPKLNTEFGFYDELSLSNAYKMQFNDLTHTNFSSLAILFENRDPRQDFSELRIKESYQWVTKCVLNFLNANLKGEQEAKIFMQNSPEKNGAKSGLITIERKLAIEKPFVFNDFHDIAISQDYHDMEILYSETLKKNPELELPEGKLNYIGLQLSYHKNIEAAIRLFDFAISIYPTSGNLYDSLGETYFLKGDKPNAILSFKKSLELDSENENAKKRLEQLK